MLDIPAGALATATTITLSSIATPSSDVLIGTAIGGAVEGSPDGQAFLKPIEIVLPYSDALVPAGTDVTTAKILTAPKGSTKFTELDSTVDKATHTVHAATTHFTTFVPTVHTLSSGALVLANVTPSSVVFAGGLGGNAGFRITGSNFPTYGSALWDGTSENVTYWGLSSTEANISVFNRTTLGTHKLRIRRLDAKGETVLETSNELEVTVVPPPPVPTLTSVTPNTTPASVHDLPIRVVGTGFTSTSKVNGYPTTFVSATVLDAVVPGSSLESGATIAIKVFTPAPGGGTSNATNLTVQATPGPVLWGVKPETIAPGSGAFTLQVTTASAVPAGSKIVFGSTELATTISTDPSMYGRVASATVPASLVTTAGRFAVAIVDPAKGSSNLYPFEVMGGLPCSATNVDLDGDSGNGCETDLSSGPVCITLRRGGFYGGCSSYRTVEHPSFAKKDDVSPAWILTDSPGLNQLTGASPTTPAPLFIQEGSTSIYRRSDDPISQLDTSNGQLIFAGARAGSQSPSDKCPLGFPPVIEVRCKGTVTLVPLTELSQ